MISMEKSYKTRDGRAVRVLCVDKASMNWPLVVLVMAEDGLEDMCQYNESGHMNCGLSGHDTGADLIEIKPTRICFVNWRKDYGSPHFYTSKDEAESDAFGFGAKHFDIIARRVELPIEEQE